MLGNELPKKNLIIISGSGDTFVWFRLQLLREFQKKGYTIFALSPEISDDALRVLNENNIVFIKTALERKSFNFINLGISIFQLLKIYRDINPKITISYMHKSIIASNITSRILSLKNTYSMITGLGHIYYDHSFRGRLIQLIVSFLLKVSLKRAKKVFFQNQDDLNAFINKGIISRSQAMIINGSGINLQEFPETGLPSTLRFITIARLIKSKGLHEFAMAARIVKETYPLAEFFIYGYEDQHSDSISKEEIENQWYEKYGVEFKGFTSNVYRALSECYCYVLLSHHEGTPRSVLEAMSVGRPIIVTDAPGCRETVIDNLNGLIVPIKDHVAAASAMIKIIQKDLAFKMAKQSRMLAEKKYDVRKVNKVILQEIFNDR